MYCKASFSALRDTNVRVLWEVILGLAAHVVAFYSDLLKLVATATIRCFFLYAILTDRKQNGGVRLGDLL
jgi:hypothetical protein